MMPIKSLNVTTLTLLIFFTGCNNSQKSTSQNKDLSEEFTFSIKDMTDEEYPDNPDIGFRSEHYNTDFFTNGQVNASNSGDYQYNLTFYTQTSDTISLRNIDLSEFIPTIPSDIKNDNYLSYIACINQEWNRNQVEFGQGQFTSSSPTIVRVDLARNCLNAYLWEVILYVKEKDKVLPFSHGWFDFPHNLYAQLFEQKNNVSFNTYRKPLENWVDPESEKIDLTKLRKLVRSLPIPVSDVSDEMYPLAGERKKKRKEVIFPTRFETMRNLQSDSTLFATFSPPGIYNKKDPRKTELGRFYTLKQAHVNQTISNIQGDTLYEIDLEFQHKNGNPITSLIIGGLDFRQFPVLSVENANDGWKSSMGIGNHTFYETYKTHNETKAVSNSFYALLVDKNGKWLDSHKVGIDGPLFHFSDKQRKTLHLWLLSFERHALVGHYILKLK